MAKPSVALLLFLGVLAIPSSLSMSKEDPSDVLIEYPEVLRNETILYSYHGVDLKDPYRALEDPKNKETQRYVKLEQDITNAYLNSGANIREQLHKRIEKLYKSKVYIGADKIADKYFYFGDEGKGQYNKLYMQESLDSELRLILNPEEKLKGSDGKVTIVKVRVSPTGKKVSYIKADRKTATLHILDVPRTSSEEKEAQAKEEVLEGVCFDSCNVPLAPGIYYTTHNEGLRSNHWPYGGSNLYYHEYGTSQSRDVLIADNTERPHLLLDNFIATEDEKYLVVLAKTPGVEGTQVYYVDVEEAKKPAPAGRALKKSNLRPLVTEYGYEYKLVASKGNVLYFHTNKDAPNWKIVAIDIEKPCEQLTVIEEKPDHYLRRAVAYDGDPQVLLHYVYEGKSTLEIKSLEDAAYSQAVELPVEYENGGKISKISGLLTGVASRQPEILFTYQSPLVPRSIYRIAYDEKRKDAENVYAEKFKVAALPEGILPRNYIVKRDTCRSKDGTLIPLVIYHKKDLKLTPETPVLIDVFGARRGLRTLQYSPRLLALCEEFNGVVVKPAIRGGGEYGDAWYEAGRAANKQNSIDDAIATIEYLLQNKYTSPSHISIGGTRFGGFVSAAVAQQRPELVGAVTAYDGVLDSLRTAEEIHNLQGLAKRCVEVGCLQSHAEHTPISETHFSLLYKVNPVTNVKLPPGDPNKAKYPAVYLVTCDKAIDNRNPADTYKYGAELQYVLAKPKGQKPLLVDIKKGSGRFWGTPPKKDYVKGVADYYTFLAKVLGYKLQN